MPDHTLVVPQGQILPTLCLRKKESLSPLVAYGSRLFLCRIRAKEKQMMFYA